MIEPLAAVLSNMAHVFLTALAENGPDERMPWEWG